MLLLIGILVIINSCERVILIDLPYKKNLIVVNGIITPGYGVWVNLSSSVDIRANEASSYIPLTDAEVKIFKDGDLISEVYDNDGGNYYAQDINPEPGAEYELIFSSHGLEEASAKVIIPEPVMIIDFDTASSIKRQFYNGNILYTETEFSISFSIEDPSEKSNYYMIGIYNYDSGQQYPQAAESEDLLMNVYISDGVNVLAWSDESIDGTGREFNIGFSMQQETGYQANIEFVLYSITEDYFKYMKSYSRNFTILNEDAILFEGVQVHSNINNGYGILAGVSSDSRSFQYNFLP